MCEWLNYVTINRSIMLEMNVIQHTECLLSTVYKGKKIHFNRIVQVIPFILKRFACSFFSLISETGLMILISVNTFNILDVVMIFIF